MTQRHCLVALSLAAALALTTACGGSPMLSANHRLLYTWVGAVPGTNGSSTTYNLTVSETGGTLQLTGVADTAFGAMTAPSHYTCAGSATFHDPETHFDFLATSGPTSTALVFDGKVSADGMNITGTFNSRGATSGGTTIAFARE